MSLKIPSNLQPEDRIKSLYPYLSSEVKGEYGLVILDLFKKIQTIPALYSETQIDQRLQGNFQVLNEKTCPWKERLTIFKAALLYAKKVSDNSSLIQILEKRLQPCRPFEDAVSALGLNSTDLPDDLPDMETHVYLFLQQILFLSIENEAELNPDDLEELIANFTDLAKDNLQPVLKRALTIAKVAQSEHKQDLIAFLEERLQDLPECPFQSSEQLNLHSQEEEPPVATWKKVFIGTTSALALLGMGYGAYRFISNRFANEGPRPCLPEEAPEECLPSEEPRPCLAQEEPYAFTIQTVVQEALDGKYGNFSKSVFQNESRFQDALTQSKFLYWIRLIQNSETIEDLRQYRHIGAFSDQISHDDFLRIKQTSTQDLPNFIEEAAQHQGHPLAPLYKLAQDWPLNFAGDSAIVVHQATPYGKELISSSKIQNSTVAQVEQEISSLLESIPSKDQNVVLHHFASSRKPLKKEFYTQRHQLLALMKSPQFSRVNPSLMVSLYRHGLYWNDLEMIQTSLENASFVEDPALIFATHNLNFELFSLIVSEYRNRVTSNVAYRAFNQLNRQTLRNEYDVEGNFEMAVTQNKPVTTMRSQVREAFPKMERSPLFKHDLIHNPRLKPLTMDQCEKWYWSRSISMPSLQELLAAQLPLMGNPSATDAALLKDQKERDSWVCKE